MRRCWARSNGRPRSIVKGLALFKELSKDGILNPGADGTEQYPDINNDFVSGKLPMVQMGTWYQQNTVTSYLRQNVEAAGVSASTKLSTLIPVPFPNVGGHPVTLFGDPDYGLAVSTNSKVKNAATTFALWLSSTKAGQLRVGDNLDEYPVLTGVSANFSSLPLVDAKRPSAGAQQAGGARQPGHADQKCRYFPGYGHRDSNCRPERA